jgi:hypothetical protein
MGRGLSELQKKILIMAYRNGGRGYGAGDVKNTEILIEVYKFPSHPPSANTSSGTPQIFRRNEIGIRKYRSASVSVVKSFNRLIGRGLAVRKYNQGIILTAKGTKTAKNLLKERKSIKNISRVSNKVTTPNARTCARIIGRK